MKMATHLAMSTPTTVVVATTTTKMVVVSLTTMVVVSLTTNKVEVVSLTTNLQMFDSFLLVQQLPSIRCHTSSSGCCTIFTHFTFWLFGGSFKMDQLSRPNGTIFDCELGCFVPIEEYHRRRSKESLVSVKEEEQEKEEN